jgi:ribonuclease HII
MPDFVIEQRYAPERICGVDEAGRGPWAGPVVAAAFLFLPEATPPEGLNDSKLLTAKRRAQLFEALHRRTDVAFGIAQASCEEIDALGIWNATQLAMRRAYATMPQKADRALIDGNLRPADFPCPTLPIIGGDGLSLSIAAASILAKVTRDRLMAEYARQFPHYGFEQHAGYGTRQHREAIAQYGVCPIHRRSYAPIREALRIQEAA